jgi:hypoxanthine phosphoribosyltransferase
MSSHFLDLTANSYSKAAYGSVSQLIANAEMQLDGQDIQFDSMVGIGNSGLLVLPILARHFCVPFFALRKPGQISHNSKQPEGDGVIGHNWILIDDVKVLGNTINYAVKTIGKLARQHNFIACYRGTYLYEPMSQSPGEFVHPDDVATSVMQVTNPNGTTRYITYGVYAKVKEVLELSSGPVEAIQRVIVKYPHWNFDDISSSAYSI